ncbi:uncharacterized protein LOC130368972 [Hyla sarda]|uniref:uncharacterized protein LOC130368972 n=1 Tax=Hyla sarda TaxID=327740 RepID=UPI0024C31612|nr:uncharacterized protein LOC130368972 [Hyla sarda]XP_056429492.1 uncharacterized protein LOC130368972 [Hyla sarda]XP_056429493.1 uncharacterized protein LOC130368972 [Hyla sarda]
MSVQDKLLDILGPLTKILNLAEHAVATGGSVDAGVLRNWALRATCLLGNANSAMSAERRRSIVMRRDPQLTHLATEELGPSAEGLLFGDSLIKNINKFVGLFSSLDKAQSSLKKSTKVFGRAGRGKGQPSGRGAFVRPYVRPTVQYVQDRHQPQSVPASVVSNPFYPTRGRPWRARGSSRGFSRGRGTGGLDYSESVFNPCGGQTEVFFPPLVSDFIRPVGVASNQRIRDRLHVHTSAVSLADSHSLLRGRQGSDFQRNHGSATQKCHNAGPYGQTGFPEQPLLGEEKRWRPQARHKSEGSKRICLVSTLQDGGHTLTLGFASSRRLAGKDRSEGRVPHGTDSPFFPAVSTVHLGRREVGVHLPPVRSLVCSMVLHQTVETGCGPSQEPGGENLHISRRYIDHGSIPSADSAARGVDTFPSHRFGFPCQPRKVGLRSYTGHRVPGVHGEYPYGNIESPSQETHTASQRDKIPAREGPSFPPGGCPNCGTAVCLYAGNSAGASSLQGVTTFEKREISSGSDLCRQGLPVPGGTRRSVVVASPCPGLEWQDDIQLDILLGWGARCGSSSMGGKWSPEESQWHINCLELLAGFFAVKCFASHKSNCCILLRMDNISAVRYINHLGGTRSKMLADIAKDCWLFCLQKNIVLVAEYLPGVSNSVADWNSRYLRDSGDWTLHPSVFQLIWDLWGPLDLDLFASRLNRKLPCFSSWKPDPEALAMDAFLQTWPQGTLYAFPPFAMIPKVLWQAGSQGSTLVVVTPWWPTQSWFPQVLGMTIDCPRICPVFTSLLQDPRKEAHPLVLSGQLQLVAWLISGCQDLTTAFHSQLGTSCEMLGLQVPGQLIDLPGDYGFIGAHNGKWIPFKPLCPES